MAAPTKAASVAHPRSVAFPAADAGSSNTGPKPAPSRPRYTAKPMSAPPSAGSSAS